MVQIEAQFGKVEAMFKDFCRFRIAYAERRWLALGIEIVLSEPVKYFAHRKSSIGGMASFVEQLKEKWEDFKKKERISNDFEGTEQHHACLQEILNFLEDDLPDKTRFSFVKKIFLVASTGMITDASSVLPQQYLRICRTLSSSEILILAAAFIKSRNKSWNPTESNAERWLKAIAEESGLKHTELVDYHDQSLVDKMLLSKRQHSDRSGILPGENCRLTNLAIEICKFIETYDDFNTTSKSRGSRRS